MLFCNDTHNTILLLVQHQLDVASNVIMGMGNKSLAQMTHQEVLASSETLWIIIVSHTFTENCQY